MIFKIAADSKFQLNVLKNHLQNTSFADIFYIIFGFFINQYKFVGDMGTFIFLRCQAFTGCYIEKLL